MRNLSVEMLNTVIGGLEQAGENVEQAGPTEAEGDKNQVGELEHKEQIGADEAGGALA